MYANRGENSVSAMGAGVVGEGVTGGVEGLRVFVGVTGVGMGRVMRGM